LKPIPHDQLKAKNLVISWRATVIPFDAARASPSAPRPVAQRLAHAGNPSSTIPRIEKEGADLFQFVRL
jgi:hypothetical protein